MAHGKLLYTPIPVRALSLDGDHYLSLDSSVFNVGTGDFGVDMLCQIDADTPGDFIYLFGKGLINLTSASGWYLYADKSLLKLQLRINDGNPVVTYVESAAGVFALGSEFWVRVDADRSGQARLYVNGVDVGGGSIAAVNGSLDNAEPFQVGGRLIV